MRRSALLALALAVTLAACSDHPAGPPGTDTHVTPTARQDVGVAAFGTLTGRHGYTFVLTEHEPEFERPGDARVQSASFEPAIGRVGDSILVVVDGSTQIYVNGERVSSLDGIPLEAKLVVAGTQQGAGIKAAIVSDFAAPHPSAKSDALPSGRLGPEAEPANAEAVVQPAQVALCVGQNMDYNDASIHEFNGCYGGPSVSDRVPVPNIPIGCGVLGCWQVDEISYTAALAGWIFDWPFQFRASSPGLTYHVPSPITFKLAALPASGTAFTFTGGLGIDLGVHLNLCNPFGCFDVGSLHFHILTSTHQATEAGPLRADETLEIEEVACPSVGILPIDAPPGLEPLALGICEDLTLIGAPFEAVVQAAGMRGAIGRTGSIVDFEGPDLTAALTPDSDSVVVTYREFEWAPTMPVGIKFTIETIGAIDLWTSPTIPISQGPWTAVTTPYPSTGAGFSLAANPEDLSERLQQPGRTRVVAFKVAPAPTTLTIISPTTLDQSMPMRARLTESFDGSAIESAEVRFSTTSAAGPVVTFDTTDRFGIAETMLPNGEHDVLVEYAGRDVYLPSSATQHVFVYLPTQFVIWAGNAGGITTGGRYQFWGAQWHQQVTGGDFTGDASFKGYADTVIGNGWTARGGNSTHPPEELGELIGVIVSTVITKQGDVTTGNVADHVILQVDNPDRYRPDPGHAGFGIMKVEIPTPQG